MKARWLGAVCVLGLLLVACGDDTSNPQGGSSGTAGGGATGDGGTTGDGGAASGGGGATGDGGSGEVGGAGGTPEPGPMVLTSTAYAEGGMIPVTYSCDGANISPPLAWTPGPSGTLSYAIIFRDLDNTLGHASIFDIPAATLSLPEDVERAYMPADVPGASQCDAYDGDPGYAGPCPGNPHTYEFTIYAVSTASLGLNEMSVDVDGVEDAAQAVSLASATLSATYTP
jgi:Raf kinase inhibitor-like YbhB/YbcL family protein